MRKNRTALRQTVYVPIIKANQEKIAKKISEDLKKTEGTSIVQLRSLIKTKAAPVVPDGPVDNEVARDLEQEPSEPVAGLNSVISRRGKGKGPKVVTAKRQGSKAKPNVGKKMEWFK